MQAAGPNPNLKNNPNPNQVQAAGGDSKALLAGFEAYAATQPQQRGAQDDEPPSLGDSLSFLLRRCDAQRKTLTDEYLAPEHVPNPILTLTLTLTLALTLTSRRSTC